ncbi:MAG: carbohydrate kinase (thermoresistant glucokinase family) [Pseudorhodobacter sp.]|jgi:gluconokinase
MSNYVVMGVSGCGKSHIGQAFAAAIGANFFDGDDLHPQANIDKMSRGVPLDDADREPWLDKVGQVVAVPGTVVACSSLKRKYRDQIRAIAAAPVTFLYLQGSRETLLARMSSRPGHFMPATLLDSQLATLEPPTPDERHLTADIDLSPEQIVAIFKAGLMEITE